MGREVERVFDAIVADIVAGTLSPGAKLNGPEISRRLGVSRGPVREAIRRLEERKLVECTPNAGARVVTHSPEEVIQFFYIREAFEGMAARLAAQNMTHEELADLRRIFDAEVARGRSGGYHADFHLRIVRGAYHPRLSRMMSEDFYALFMMWRRNFDWLHGDVGRSWVDHRRILEAIESRDGELAEILMRRHVSRLREQAEERLRRAREPRLVEAEA